MTVLTSAQKSLNDALTVLSQAKLTIKAGGTGAVSLSVDEFVDGVCTCADGGTTANVTTPTAAQIVAGIQGCVVGSSFIFILRNNDAGDAKTLVAGDGNVTLVGTAATSAATTATWIGVVTTVTGTPAVSVYRVA